MVPFDKVFAEILTSGGAWGAVAIVLGAACVYLYLYARSSQAARIKDAQQCSSEKAASYEKRIEEMGRMTSALEKNASMSLSLIGSLTALESTTAELVKVVSVLVETFKVEQGSGKTTLERMERRQERILETMLPRGHQP